VTQRTLVPARVRRRHFNTVTTTDSPRTCSRCPAVNRRPARRPVRPR